MEWRYWADAVLAFTLIPILITGIVILWIPFQILRFFGR